jgi:hypothetical protein
MDPQEERVESALSQLIDHFLPATEYEDESDAEARQDEVLERVQETIEGYRPTETVVDIQHLGDLIKKKCVGLVSATCCTN